MTTRATPRRRGTAPASLWPVSLAVLATVAALVVAGLGGPPTIRSDRQTHAVAVARTFACAGGLPGARATGGRATSGGAVATAIGATPHVVEVPAPSAAEGYAFQESRPRGGLATTPCPEPRAQWWLTGLGGSGLHTSRVLLANPREADAVVDVQVLGPDGPVNVPSLRGLAVPHGGSRVLDLAAVAPAQGELAVHVSASRGLVSAVSADRYATGLLDRPMQEWVPGTTKPSRHAFLTGLPDRADDATLVLANPGQVGTLVTLRVAGERGTFTLPGHEEVRVPPDGTLSVDVAKAFDGRPTALRVEAQRPVTATLRTVTGSDLSYAASGTAVLRPSTLGVPDGVDARVEVTSTGGSSRVRVTGYDADGRRTDSREVSVQADTTTGVGLARGTRAVVLEPLDRPVVAGLLLEAGPGTAGATFPPAGAASRAPAVRPG